MKAVMFCQVQVPPLLFTLMGVDALQLSFMTILFPKAERLTLTGKNEWEKSKANIHTLIKDSSICIQDCYTYTTIRLTETF